LRKEYCDILGTSLHYRNVDSDTSRIEQDCKDKALKELTSDLPTKNSIKSAIVLEAMSGSNNILEAIKTKFELND